MDFIDLGWVMLNVTDLSLMAGFFDAGMYLPLVQAGLVRWSLRDDLDIGAAPRPVPASHPLRTLFRHCRTGFVCNTTKLLRPTRHPIR